MVSRIADKSPVFRIGILEISPSSWSVLIPFFFRTLIGVVFRIEENLVMFRIVRVSVVIGTGIKFKYF